LRPTKLLVVVLENHAPDSVEREMPWLSAQGRQYGSATPDSHQLDGASVFGQGAAPGAARTYAEGMSEPCEQHNDGRYAVRHNPWAYFPAEGTACRRDDVPAGTPSGGALQSDLAAGRMPTFGLLIPDVCNDAHDCELSTADQWLASWGKAIQAGADWKAGRLAVLVTFDEDDHSAGNHITAVLMHPSLHGVRVDQRLDHRDLSASASRLLGAQPLREAAGRAGVLAAFGLA
jgi:acid phosphatase